MWRPIVVQTPPSAEPVALADAKKHLWIDHDDDDDMIRALVAAARAHVESVTGQRLMAQALILKAEAWSDLECLPVAPVSAVISVGYVDGDGAEKTLDAGGYEVRLEGLAPMIVPSHGVTWPHRQAGSQVTVQVTAGYATAAAVPPELIAAVKLLVGDLYAYRETGQVGSVSSEIKTTATVEALLANHRRWL